MAPIVVLRRAAAVFFVLHGIAHLVGFVAAWRLGRLEDVPYGTLVLNGSVDVGEAGMRLVGLLWLAGAIAFVAAAAAVLRERYRLVAGVAAFSLGLCVVGLPAAIVGFWIDTAILGILGGLALVRPAVLQPARR